MAKQRKKKAKAAHVEREWRLLWKGHLHGLAYQTEEEAERSRRHFHPEANVVHVEVKVI